MGDTEHEHVRHWRYPIFTVLDTEDTSLVATEFEGQGCVLLYNTKELAELYVEQANEMAGRQAFAPAGFRADDELLDFLKRLPSEVGFVVWDTVMNPSNFKLVPVQEVINVIAGR